MPRSPASSTIPRGSPPGPKQVRIDRPRSSERERRESEVSLRRYPGGGWGRPEPSPASAVLAAGACAPSIGARSESAISVARLGERLFVAALTTSSICAGERVMEMLRESSLLMPAMIADADDCPQGVFFIGLARSLLPVGSAAAKRPRSSGRSGVGTPGEAASEDVLACAIIVM